jgi:hypothetical protein
MNVIIILVKQTVIAHKLKMFLVVRQWTAIYTDIQSTYQINFDVQVLSSDFGINNMQRQSLDQSSF